MVGSCNPRQQSWPSTNGASCAAMTLHCARGALRCCRYVGETSSAGAEPLRAAVAGCLVAAGGGAKARAPRRSAKKASAPRPASGGERRERTTRRTTVRAQPLRASMRVVSGLRRLQAPPDLTGPGSAKRGRCARALVAWPLREKRLRARSPGGSGSNTALLGASLRLRQRGRVGCSSSPEPSGIPGQAAREIAVALGSAGAGHRKLSFPA